VLSCEAELLTELNIFMNVVEMAQQEQLEDKKAKVEIFNKFLKDLQNIMAETGLKNLFFFLLW
jgi:hypothetical protein